MLKMLKLLFFVLYIYVLSDVSINFLFALKKTKILTKENHAFKNRND